MHVSHCNWPHMSAAIDSSSSPHPPVTIVVDHQPLHQLQQPPPLSFLLRTHLIVPSLCVSLIASKTSLLWTHHSPQSISRIAVTFLEGGKQRRFSKYRDIQWQKSEENWHMQSTRVQDSDVSCSIAIYPETLVLTYALISRSLLSSDFYRKMKVKLLSPFRLEMADIAPNHQHAAQSCQV